MAVTATLNQNTGGVEIIATDILLPDFTGSASFERAANGGPWELVATRMSFGGTASAVDYFYPAGVPLQYRIRYTPIPHVVGAGTAADGNGATPLNPPLPADAKVGDWLLVVSACRNTAVTPVVSGGLGGGYSPHSGAYCLNLTSKVMDVGEPAPTVSFPGAVAGDSTSARVVAVRGVNGPDNIVALDTAAGTTVVPFPGITPPSGVGAFVVAAAWAQDDWAGTAAPATWFTVFSQINTAGNDQAMTLIRHTATVSPVPGGSITAARASSISKALTMSYQKMTEQTVSSSVATPDPDRTVLVVSGVTTPGSPSYAAPVKVVGWSDPERDARTALIPISGSSRPVAVSDVAGPQRWTLELELPDQYAARELDEALTEGQAVYLRSTDTCPFPTGWHSVGARKIGRRAARGVKRYATLALTECAAPAVA